MCVEVICVKRDGVEALCVEVMCAEAICVDVMCVDVMCDPLPVVIEGGTQRRRRCLVV